MDQPLPERETQVIERPALGDEIDYFPARFQRLNRWLVVALGSLLLLDAVIYSLISTLDLWHAIQSHGRAVLLVKIQDPIVAVCLFLPVGILLVVLAAINWLNGITLFENGLVIRRHNQEDAWFWDSIDRFDNQITLVKFSGTNITIRRRVILEDDQQNRLIIRNSYIRMDELIAQLRTLILPGVFKKLHHKLQQGGEISFHPSLTVIKEGLWIKETFFPWNEVQLNVDKKGKIQIISQVDQQVIFKLKTNQVRNIDVLMHLAENPPIPHY